MQIAEHRKRMAERISPNPERRTKLIADLRQRTERLVPQPAWSRSILNFHTRIGNLMNPILASAAIIMAATFLLVWVWQRSTVPINAAQIIQRAEASDQAVSREKAGVVFQRVRITTPRLMLEREIYRDPRGIRHQRPEAVQADTVQIRHVLASVGVDWNAPLSAASYHEWHDQQVSVTDEVRKEDGNLLKLTSKVPNNWIQEESLTVRASDFHPVERTIETRSYGTIEISELSYVVLPWSGVNEALFEPLAGISPVGAHPSRIILPSVPSPTELDSAELSARLTLNRLRADEGEQINVLRTDRAVEVKGIVETDERRQELVNQLRLVPHVNVEILSIPELQSIPHSQTATQSVTMQSMDVQPSPLERYLDAQGGRMSELSGASQQLLDAALKVRQNAGELFTVEKRFSALDESGANNFAFAHLVQSYSERLIAGLDAEDATLHALGFETPQQTSSAETNTDLVSEVDRNEALCRELIAGNTENARSASEIVLDIYESAARIRLAVAALPSPAH